MNKTSYDNRELLCRTPKSVLARRYTDISPEKLREHYEKEIRARAGLLVQKETKKTILAFERLYEVFVKWDYA